MNRTYNLVWNHCLGAWNVTSEHARRRGKGGGAVLTAALLLPAVSGAAGLPGGGQVVSGSGGISTPSSQQMVIQQNSNKLAINWQSFDVAAGNKVTFKQPSRDAVALNRVQGADGSKIMGQLDANGQVFIVNPNGVLFGKDAQVNVGGLVASTLDLSVKDFEAGNYQFKGDGHNAGVINQGTLKADGGAVALLGGSVSNQGVIVAKEGTVALAAGNKVTLDFAGDGLLNVQVDEGTAHALVENRQLIKADGGRVLLTAAAADAVVKAVVNNDGVIQAHRLAEKDGKVLLLADMQHGKLTAAGTLEADFVETSAATVHIDKNLKVNTAGGEWLIDPVDITIDTGKATAIESALNSGDVTVTTAGPSSDKGDIHVNADISYSQNKLTLHADNNINVNARINVNGSATLALNYGGTAGVSTATPAAGSNLNVSGQVNFAQSGANLLTVNGKAFTVIKDATALQAMGTALNGNYALGGDVDASATASWNSGLGFNPVGIDTSSFTGTFDGLGHTINGLSIKRPNLQYVGLFGFTENATLRNVGLVGGSVNGRGYVGGLVGYQFRGNISNAYATGAVSGTNYYVGGLVGYQYGGNISNAYATGGAQSPGDYVGGLVGYQYNGNISNAYATGAVSGRSYVGGLVGFHYNGNIINAYATGAVTGTGDLLGGLVGYQYGGNISNAYATGGAQSPGDYVGGLVGFHYNGNISNAYATGAVSGTEGVGGLVGSLNLGSNINVYATGVVSGDLNIGGLVGQSSGYISNAYATGSVGGEIQIGGLVGFLSLGNINNAYATGTVSATDRMAGGLVGANGGSISNVYATGAVSGTSYFGGLVGFLNGSLSNGYYATTAADGTPINNSGNTTGIGKTWAQLTQLDTYLGWEIDALGGTSMVWRLYEGSATPLLRSFLKAVSVTVDAGSLVAKTYDRAQAHGTFTYTTNLPGVLLDGTATYRTNAANAGTYSLSDGSITSGLYSGQQGYDISYNPAGASLTINKANLAVTGISADNKTYDGTTTATLSGTASVSALGADVVGVSGTGVGSFADKNAGIGKAVTVSGYTLTGADAGNYTLIQSSGLTANISQAVINAVTGITATDRTYNGLTAATLDSSSASFDGMVAGDDLNVASASGSFIDKNAGIGKLVSISNIVLGGADAGNYTLSSTTASTTASIYRALISAVTGITAADRTYNGLTTATLNSSGAGFTGMVTGDDLNVASASGNFADKNAGNNKQVAISGITLGGADAGNYTLSADTASTTASITRKALTVRAENVRARQGEAASLRYSVDGLVAGDAVSGVSLSSAGQGSAAAPGTYLISVSDAQGSGLSNYDIRYESGTLSVDPAFSSDPAYTAALVSAVQLPAQNPLSLQLPASEMQADQQLAALSDLSLTIENGGIRLPEGL